MPKDLVSDVGQTDKIHQALEKKNYCKSEHFVDAGYVDSALLIDSRKNYQVKLVDPIRPNSSWQARQPFAYDKSQFKINWKTKKVTCPQGHKSITWTPNIDRWGNPGIQVRFSRSECFKCPQREQCCRSKKDGRTLRFLPKPEHKAIEDLRQQMETPQ